jgi:hypothetical protein
MGERVFERVFWGPILNSSPMLDMAMFQVAQKEKHR